MKKLLFAAMACVLGLSAQATLSWETGDYTPADWVAAENNLLTNATASSNGKWYTEGGKSLSNSPATLTDGVVPGTTCDYKKIAGIANDMVLTWEFDDLYKLQGAVGTLPAGGG